MPTKIQSQRRRPRGSGSGPASDIRQSGAVAGSAFVGLAAVVGGGAQVLGSGIGGTVLPVDTVTTTGSASSTGSPLPTGSAAGVGGTGTDGVTVVGSPGGGVTAGAASAIVKAVPQLEQKRLPSGFSLPHVGQAINAVLRGGSGSRAGPP